MLKSRRRRAAAALAALVTVAVAPAVGADAAPGGGDGHAYGLAKKAVPESPLGSYLVIVAADPLVAGFSQGELRSAAARGRAAEIASAHNDLLAAVGASADTKTYSYTNAVNGFAATITHEQAEKIAGLPSVAAVVPNELQQPQTDTSGTFLGLNAPGGAWTSGLTGEDVVVGVIDSGIWPEHPSFSDDVDGDGVSDYDAPPITIEEVTAEDYVGVDRTWAPCAFGNDQHVLAAGLEDFDFECNNKLIGARWVLDSYVEAVGLTDVEYASARDENGHGTHTASTAAGNSGVEAQIFDIARGVVSGVAPDARIVAYKALGELGGTSADLAMAIDLAVYDGVDVINYSIGSSSFAIGVDDVSFLFAREAGVHVATSNGNAGPGAATIGSPASVPWVTSVGASTHTRTFEGSVTVGLPGDKPKKAPPAPITVHGASLTPGTGVLQIVDAADFGNELCLSNVRFRGNIAGKIVLCRRGENARIDKSFAVYQAGGAGMVLYNVDDVSDLVTDSHWVPSVHVNYTDGLAVKAAIAAGKKVYAQIAQGEATGWQGSAMAAFSSRGPNLQSSDIIKPDVTAPGVNILAGNSLTPVGAPHGQAFQAISGTSMSSPHVAGLFALFAEANPDASPAAAKSALMTSARQDVTKEDRETQADPFDMGSGHVVPGTVNELGSFFNPGIVYPDSEYGAANDGAAYLCHIGIDITGGDCAVYTSIVMTDVSNYNMASIAIGELPGSQTVQRTIQNVSGGQLTLTPLADAPDGYAVSVEPPMIEIADGAFATFEVTITNVDAEVGEWAFGSLTLDGGGVSAYAPIAVRGVALAAPPVVGGAILDRGTSFEVSFGYTGEFAAVPHGLTPAVVETATVAQDPDQTFDPGDVGAGGAVAHIVEVADAALVRFRVPPLANAATDLDLFVYGPDGTEVGASTNGSTNETVDLLLPAAGTYTAYVHGWSVGGTPVDYEFHSYVVPNPPGNLEATAPTDVVAGMTGTVALSWPDTLTSGNYLGVVELQSTSATEAITLVEVSG